MGMKEKRFVKFDEDNLKKNEEIKSKMNIKKIDEPKTPAVKYPYKKNESSFEYEIKRVSSSEEE